MIVKDTDMGNLCRILFNAGVPFEFKPEKIDGSDVTIGGFIFVEVAETDYFMQFHFNHDGETLGIEHKCKNLSDQTSNL